MQTPVQRFWSKVDTSGVCWTWTAGKTTAGYGVLRVNGVGRYAHRLSYEFHIGPIPTGKHVLHRCDNPPCVNPAHLFLGDQTANNRDAAAKGRTPHGIGHYNARVGEAEVLAIRELYASGLTQRVIASRYGISQQEVHKIVARKTWAHLQ